jgi:hypothetical protein
VAAAWVGGLWMFHAIVHSELRYNFPVLPFAFFLACCGAEVLWVASRCAPRLPAR